MGGLVSLVGDIENCRFGKKFLRAPDVA